MIIHVELILIADRVEPDVAHEVGPLFAEESDLELDVEPDDQPVIQLVVQAQEEPIDPDVQPEEVPVVPDEEPVVQAQEEVVREARAEEEHVVAAEVGVRTRKQSERIVKLKLAKNWGVREAMQKSH